MHVERSELWGRLLCSPDPSSAACHLFYLPKQNKFLSILSDFLPDRIFCFHLRPRRLPRMFSSPAAQGSRPVGRLQLRVGIPSSSFPALSSFLRPARGLGVWGAAARAPALRRGCGRPPPIPALWPEQVGAAGPRSDCSVTCCGRELHPILGGCPGRYPRKLVQEPQPCSSVFSNRERVSPLQSFLQTEFSS